MKKYIVLFSAFFALASCEVDESLNIDQKSPTSVPASGLFTNAARNFFDQMNGSHHYRLYAQYWAQTTYPETSQYIMTGLQDNIWSSLYSGVLQDLKGAREIIAIEGAANSKNQLAIIEMLEVYAFSVLVDTYGNVPYSEALDPLNPSPKYDDAAEIYTDILSRLDGAISNMGAGAGFEASQDPIYGGDMNLWKKAANSLKLRLAMRLADINPAVAQQKATEAATGVITSNAENFGINYLSSAPNTNPLWVTLVQSGRNDYVAANTMVDAMNSLNDPRLDYYFELKDGAYKGGIYGDANAASGFSAVSDELKNPALKGNLITASEVSFLLAEAAARGFNVTGSAETHYSNGVTTSIENWGGTESDATTYLAQSSVAYNTAAGDWKTKIGTQKWIAMYNNNFEGWTTYRLFDNPVLNAAPGMSIQDIPTRILYPISEATLNGPALNSAISAIGGNNKTTKLFWDKF